MSNVSPERGIYLHQLIDLTSDQFWYEDLPTLPPREAAGRSRAIRREKSPVAAFSNAENAIASRGLWVHLDIVQRGIQSRTDHPRLVPHVVEDTLWQIDGFARGSVAAIDRIKPYLEADGDLETNQHYLALVALAEFTRAQRRTKEKDGWRAGLSHAQMKREVNDAFIEVCALEEPQKKRLSIQALAAHRQRIRFHRAQLLENAKFHPAVHELIMAYRESDHLVEEDVSE